MDFEVWWKPWNCSVQYAPFNLMKRERKINNLCQLPESIPRGNHCQWQKLSIVSIINSFGTYQSHFMYYVCTSISWVTTFKWNGLTSCHLERRLAHSCFCLLPSLCPGYLSFYLILLVTAYLSRENPYGWPTCSSFHLFFYLFDLFLYYSLYACFRYSGTAWHTAFCSRQSSSSST